MIKVIRNSAAFIIVDAQNFVLHENGLNVEWGVWKFAQRKGIVKSTVKAIERFRKANRVHQIRILT